MTNPQSLSAAQIVDLAARACADGDYNRLQLLQRFRVDVLGSQLCCRLLWTFLPVNEQPERYLPLLKQLCGDYSPEPWDKDFQPLFHGALQEVIARQRVQRMCLQQIPEWDWDAIEPVDATIKFISQQAHRMAAHSGDLHAIRNLIEPFVYSARPLEEQLLEVQRQITYDAVTTALHLGDFDTAYSTVLTRLSPPMEVSGGLSRVDDTSWRVAFAAGRYQQKNTSSERNISGQAEFLNKRLELLSLSLSLAPNPPELPFILATWQQCEADLKAWRDKETALEDEWNIQGDAVGIPGSFASEGEASGTAEAQRARRQKKALAHMRSKLDQEENPMGLFEVAREAASAIGKTAFLPRGDSSKLGASSLRPKIHGATQPENAQERQLTSTHEGTRKRDMVSNMVTGGLVSGLGWMLGAQPMDTERNIDFEGEVDQHHP